MLAEVLQPIKTRSGSLRPGETVDLPEIVTQRLGSKLRIIKTEPAVNIAPLPRWQHNLCLAHSEFLGVAGNCPYSLDDCLISRIIDSNGDTNMLRDIELGHSVNSNDIFGLLSEGNDQSDILIKQPLWLIFLAKFITSRSEE